MVANKLIFGGKLMQMSRLSTFVCVCGCVEAISNGSAVGISGREKQGNVEEKRTRNHREPQNLTSKRRRNESKKKKAKKKTAPAGGGGKGTPPTPTSEGAGGGGGGGVGMARRRNAPSPAFRIFMRSVRKTERRRLLFPIGRKKKQTKKPSLPLPKCPAFPSSSSVPVLPSRLSGPFCFLHFSFLFFFSVFENNFFASCRLETSAREYSRALPIRSISKCFFFCSVRTKILREIG